MNRFVKTLAVFCIALTGLSLAAWAEPTLQLVSPAAGETFVSGQVVDIVWTLAGATSLTPIRTFISVQQSPFASQFLLLTSSASSTNGVNHFAWKVPPGINGPWALQVRFDYTDPQYVFDNSDGPFQIIDNTVQPTVAVVWPNGNESLQGGQFYDFQWTFGGLPIQSPVPTTLSLVRSMTNQAPIILSSVTTTSNGTNHLYVYVPSGAAGHDVRLRVTLNQPLTNGSVSDDSDANNIVLLGPLSPPVISPLSNQTIAPDQLLALSVSATDVDRDTLTFQVNGQPASATFYAMGDVTHNGELSALDATRILQVVAGPSTFSEEDKILADVTENGGISSLDATRVLQLSTGLKSPLNRYYLFWRPTAADIGSSYQVSFTVTDANGLSHTTPISISVNAGSAAIGSTPIPDSLGAQPPEAAGTAAISVRVHPNPFRASRGDSAITFDHMSNGNTIKIFTVSGRWVKTLSAPTGSVSWDLTNDSGDKVASGLYLFLVTDPQGNTTRGKFAIIR